MAYTSDCPAVEKQGCRQVCLLSRILTSVGRLGCRKAVASAFSTANMKAEFPNIRLACSQLIDVLKTVGADEVVDMDNALCRESLDVIGGMLPPVTRGQISPEGFHTPSNFSVASTANEPMPIDEDIKA